ncbi:LCP family protein [Bifidobacterium sp.]|uniref:LCP family protein n=1 Tax=Bifidobacterium sp. TaxID=41200 RepID=UPI0025C35779|nr:LCP family protein [Bifidobacterium sp.]MCH4209163.1 LCP family protein [Bifidobacterium sp.]MCI1224609.1 LCP family protein [Bifidobacterium sp.]
MTSHRDVKHVVPDLSNWRGTHPRHSGNYRMRRTALGTLATVLVAALVFLTAAIAPAVIDLGNEYRVVQVVTQPNAKPVDPVDPNAGKPISFLLLGQDTRDGAGNEAIGGGGKADQGYHNADTTMVVQISADRSYINLVSIPRDSLVDIPSCTTPKGTIPAQYNTMFNSIFSSAWNRGDGLSSAASCTLNAVNALTGLDLQQFIVVDFEGLKGMIDAVGGVDVCVPIDTKDKYTDLDLKKGMQHLNGLNATRYARMRHGTGTDGTDIMRTTRQQYLIKQLLNESMSKNLFTQTSQLYQLAKAALHSLDFSNGLGNIATLVGLAISLKNMDPTHLYAQTLPVTPAPSDHNRRVWAPEADAVWAKLRNQQPLTLVKATGGSSSSPSASASDSASSSSSASATPAATPDPVTGLITEADGTLIDPNTGGIVNPKDGSITDPHTMEYIGIADRYLNATVCAVPAQK